MRRTNVEYEILSNLPIEVVVDAESTSATICWKYKVKTSYDNDTCKVDEFQSTQCENVIITPNNKCEENIVEGVLAWKDKNVPYKITQNANLKYCECKKPFEGKRYELLDYWFEKNTFNCGLEENAELFYKYNELSVNSECEIVKTEITASTNVPIVCSNGNTVSRNTNFVSLIMPDGLHMVDYSYICKPCEEKCEKNTTIKIGEITYDIVSYTLEGNVKKDIKHYDYITCKGYKENGNKVINEVNYTVEYVKIDIDENCEKTETNGVYNGIWKPLPCNGNECCSSHYVTISVTVTDASSDLINQTFDLSVIMKGDSEKQCNQNCECQPTIQETLYCVDQNSVQVLYPEIDSGGTLQWVSDRVVSRYGGEVKVVFEYTAHTTTLDCSTPPNETKDEIIGIHEEIVTMKPTWNGDDKTYRSGVISNLKITFRSPNENGCNVLTYSVNQEVPS